MPDIFQSIRTKIEFIMICVALIGMMSTGIYVYHDQTSRLNIHETDIDRIKQKNERQDIHAQALADVIASTVIPTLNAQGKEMIGHSTRIETMEQNARADREILIEIRNDLKWIKDRSK